MVKQQAHPSVKIGALSLSGLFPPLNGRWSLTTDASCV